MNKIITIYNNKYKFVIIMIYTSKQDVYMLAIHEIRKLFNQLSMNFHAQVTVDNQLIKVNIVDNSSKIYLSTDVYQDHDYIPPSVRLCTKASPVFIHQSPLHNCYLSLDEKNYSITLNYIGILEHLDNEAFRSLLEEFAWLGNQWERYLDDNDKKDLLHVRVK